MEFAIWIVLVVIMVTLFFVHFEINKIRVALEAQKTQEWKENRQVQ